MRPLQPLILRSLLFSVLVACPFDHSSESSFVDFEAINDREKVLNAVLCDVLLSPDLTHIRDEYADGNSTTAVLLNNSFFQLSWPSAWRPCVPGFSFSVHDESEETVLCPKRSMGLRLSRFDPFSKEVDPFFGNITVTVMPLWKSQGSRNFAVASINYSAKKLENGHWEITCVSIR